MLNLKYSDDSNPSPFRFLALLKVLIIFGPRKKRTFLSASLKLLKEKKSKTNKISKLMVN